METPPSSIIERDDELVSLPQLSKITDIPLSWFYERSRFNALPGQYRIGHYVRVHLPEFMAALREGAIK